MEATLLSLICVGSLELIFIRSMLGILLAYMEWGTERRYTIIVSLRIAIVMWNLSTQRTLFLSNRNFAKHNFSFMDKKIQVGVISDKFTLRRLRKPSFGQSISRWKASQDAAVSTTPFKNLLMQVCLILLPSPRNPYLPKSIPFLITISHNCLVMIATSSFFRTTRIVLRW